MNREQEFTIRELERVMDYLKDDDFIWSSNVISLSEDTDDIADWAWMRVEANIYEAYKRGAPGIEY